MHSFATQQTAPNASLTPRLDEDSAPQRQPVRRGSTCPKCQQAILDYNGLLDLECPNCGYIDGGAVGCT